MENAKERAVRASFALATRFNGYDAEYCRGPVVRRARGFFVDGGSVAETRGNVYIATETREFVVEKSALGALFPPRPRDELKIVEAGGARIWSLVAASPEPIWSYWNRDRRFVVLRAKEVVVPTLNF